MAIDTQWMRKPKVDCNQVAEMQLIDGYLDESLSEEQIEAFEKHYLECQDCFSAIQMQHALRLATKPAEDVVGHPVVTGPNRGLKLSHPRWHLAIAALLLLLIVPLSLLVYRWMTPGLPELPAQLVAIESLPAYAETTIRGGKAGESLESFRKGMEAYQNEDYSEAVAKLRRALEENPQHLPTAFYLGLSFLMHGQTAEAADQLSRVVATGNPSYLEEARWYLAKAYFRLGRVEDGRQQLEFIRDMGGAYQRDAERNLALLKEARN